MRVPSAFRDLEAGHAVELGAEDKENEIMLRQVFESVLLLSLQPRCVISIIVQVLHSDGSVISCAVNAVCLALMDAGFVHNIVTRILHSALQA